MPATPIPPLGSKSSVSDVITGLTLPFRALGVLFSSPRLFTFAALSGLVTAATLIGLGVFLWPAAQGWGDAIVGTSGNLQKAAAFALGLLLFLGAYVTGALTVPNLLLAPLVDPISEATEGTCGDYVAPPFSVARLVRSTFESLAHTLLRLSLMLLGYVVLAPLNLVPVVGSALWAVLASIWAMYWLAVEHLSNPMARHLYRFGQVAGALRKRLMLSLGFGAALYVMLWVPVVNFFLMPVAIVAGTLLFRALKQASALPARSP